MTVGDVLVCDALVMVDSKRETAARVVESTRLQHCRTFTRAARSGRFSFQTGRNTKKLKKKVKKILNNNSRNVINRCPVSLECAFFCRRRRRRETSLVAGGLLRSASRVRNRCAGEHHLFCRSRPDDRAATASVSTLTRPVGRRTNSVRLHSFASFSLSLSLCVYCSFRHWNVGPAGDGFYERAVSCFFVSFFSRRAAARFGRA